MVISIFMENEKITSDIYLDRDHRIAFVLSFLFTGLGQAYNGELSKGLVFTALRIVTLLIIPLYAVMNDSVLILFVSAFALNFFVWIISPFEAMHSAKSKSGINLKKYNSIIFYFIYGLLSSALIFISFLTVLSFFSVKKINDNKMNPLFEKNEYILVNRYAYSGINTGDVVLYSQNKKTENGRIIAVPGNVVSIGSGKFFISEKPLELSILTDDEMNDYGIRNSEDLFYEINGSIKYPVRAKTAISSSQEKKPVIPENIQVKNKMFFVSYDNRTGENYYNFVEDKDIRGKVEGILFSRNFKKILLKPVFSE